MRKTILLLITIISFNLSQAQEVTQKEKEEKIRSEINSEFSKSFKECGAQVNAVTEYNGKTEFWKICKSKNTRILIIESHKGTVYNQEIYFEKNGNLIYAKETENFIPKNHFTQMAWNCQYYIENGKILTMTSLGHGKTEEDDWNPESIFDMYKNRLSEFEKIKQ